MNSFLDSFDDKITMHTAVDKTTHKSIDFKKGFVESNQTTTPFSTVQLENLSKNAKKHFEEYLKNGFTIIENIIPKEDLKLIQNDTKNILSNTPFGDNNFYGQNTKRAYALLAKTRSLDNLLTTRILTELIEALFAPNPLLSALQLNEIFPGEKEQKLHYDQQFSNIGSVTRGDDTLVNFILAIDDFTEKNGATVVVPGSHLWTVDRIPQPTDEKKKVVMKAGSICLFSGNLWHGGGANETNETRRGLICVFLQPWLRTLENHFLSIPFETAAKLDPKIQSYLGYSLHHPFIGLVDFKHPRKALLELVSKL